MPPTNPWGKKQQPPKTISGFPDLKPHIAINAALKSPGPKSQYEEIQEDELIALASIYGEDFRRIESNHGAWKVFNGMLPLKFNAH
jgi:translation initiation factor 2-alpha kinase 4